MAETRLERWVILQQKTWDVDQGSRAARITVERGHDEVIQNFSADLPELGRALQDCLDMQGEELPSGSHQFRLVSYDHANKQLGELPQTVKGKSKDATAAGQQAIATQRANAMAVDSLAFVLDKFRSEMEQQANRMGDMFDDVTALAESNSTMRLNNEESLLRRQEFERRMQRHDQIFETIGSVFALAAPVLLDKLGPKLFGTKPGELLSGLTSAVVKADESPPTTPKEPVNDEPITAPEKPASATSLVIPEPRPRTLSSDAQRGAARKRGPVPRKRGPKTPPVTPKKRKR